MKIELKGIKEDDLLSEENNAFTAQLYINGKLAGTVSNAGHGDTVYKATKPNGNKLIKKAEEYCKNMSSEKEDDLASCLNLETYIDRLFGDYIDKKYQKEIREYFNNNIVFSSNPHAGTRSIKLYIPIERLLIDEMGRKALIDTLSVVKGRLRVDEQILNTNIPQAIFIAAGLKEDQYVKPCVCKKQKSSRKQKR
ncbi:hypothetical protein FXV77_05510 [Sphingobacterium phlebotomi]|uniref:Uncharacterized protein n=1 Tax=Sphingobacterium phlebotomi TaxID=2605433 RepID=A0A5D4HAW4_9SPHI|nr:hypothetical protein [Sphingobacterium phlebotomi]TYR37462.1 hypothetical protein FXV77_05510 [Sphingobacterium phlebotomi]